MFQTQVVSAQFVGNSLLWLTIAISLFCKTEPLTSIFENIFSTIVHAALPKPTRNHAALQNAAAHPCQDETHPRRRSVRGAGSGGSASLPGCSEPPGTASSAAPAGGTRRCSARCCSTERQNWALAAEPASPSRSACRMRGKNHSESSYPSLESGFGGG